MPQAAGDHKRDYGRDVDTKLPVATDICMYLRNLSADRKMGRI